MKSEEKRPFGDWIHTGTEPARLLCPHCSSDDIVWLEEVTEMRHPLIEDGVLIIEGIGEACSDSGQNDRLECRGCWATVEIPVDPGIEIDYR